MFVLVSARPHILLELMLSRWKTGTVILVAACALLQLQLLVLWPPWTCGQTAGYGLSVGPVAVTAGSLPLLEIFCLRVATTADLPQWILVTGPNYGNL